MLFFNDFATVLDHHPANSVLLAIVEVAIPIGTRGKEAIS